MHTRSAAVPVTRQRRIIPCGRISYGAMVNFAARVVAQPTGTEIWTSDHARSDTCSQPSCGPTRWAWGRAGTDPIGSGEARSTLAPLPPPALPNCPCSFPASSSQAGRHPVAMLEH
jgi:hypothetical protein